MQAVLAMSSWRRHFILIPAISSHFYMRTWCPKHILLFRCAVCGRNKDASKARVRVVLPKTLSAAGVKKRAPSLDSPSKATNAKLQR